MNNKKFFTMCFFLTVIGVFLCGVGIVLGGRIYGVELGKDGFIIQTDIDKTEQDETRYIVKAEDIDSFDSISADIDFAEVNIVRSNRYGIEYRFPMDSALSYEVDDDELKVETNKRDIKDWSFTLFSIKNKIDGKLIPMLNIYIPADARLENIDIDLSGGVIRVPTLKAEEIYLKNSFGSVELSDLESEELRINVSSGNITGNDILTEDANISSSLGNIEINEMVAEDLKMKFSSGNISVGNIKAESADINCTYGAIELGGVAGDELFISSASGAIEASNVSSKKIEAESSFGAINIDLDDVDDYNMDCKANFGEVTVNGRSKGGSHVVSESSKNRSLRVNCSSGQVNIK